MKKMFAYLPSVAMVGLMVLLAAEPASAQVRLDTLTLGLFDPGRYGTGFGEIFQRVLDLFLLVSGVAAFFFIIYGGFVYLTAGGDAAKATQGRTYIVNAIIGVVIIFASYALARFIIGFTRTGVATF